jgi:soluble P-type ATPase
MLGIEIPGFKRLFLTNLVLDYNGTLACDGKVIAGVGKRLELLSDRLQVHVLTADTFASAREELAKLPCTVSVIPLENQAETKGDYIRDLGPEKCVAIGNGRNDRFMLKRAALGIALLQTEAASVEAVLAADILSSNILDALDLLLCPLRLTATLRA